MRKKKRGMYGEMGERRWRQDGGRKGEVEKYGMRV